MKTKTQALSSLAVLVFFLAEVIFCFDASAQISFKKKYQRTGTLHEANKVIETSDGGFLIAGSADGATGVGFDIFVIKLNNVGDTTWTKLVGGADNEVGMDVEQTHDNGYILTGRTKSFGTGDYDIYLIRLDSIGNVVWSKTYGEVSTDIGYVVEQTVDHGFIVAGQLQYPASGNIDACIIKVDSVGDVLWSKLIGSSFSDEFYSFIKTSSGNYLLAGIERISSTSAYLLLTNMNDSGDTLWTRTYDMGGFAFAPTSIEINNNSFIVSGSVTQSPSTFNDFFALNIDSTGIIKWAKLYPIQNDDYCSAIVSQSNGNFILNGFTSPALSANFDGMYLSIDSLGNSLGARIFPTGNLEISNSGVYTTQGCYAAVASELDFSNGIQSIVFSKTDSLMNPACSYRDTIISPLAISPQSVNAFLSVSSWSGGNSFTPTANSGLSDTTICAVFTSVSNPAETLFNVFPNPFDSDIQITFKDKDDYKIMVLDMAGKEMMSTVTNALQSKLELRDCAKGIYLLSITSKEGSYYQKLIKG